MSRSGQAEVAEGTGTHHHACVVFDRPADFRSRALAYLSAGVEAGERACYLEPAAELPLIDFAGFEALRAAVATGAARVLPVDDAYAATTVMDPAAVVAHFADLVTEALADGFAGLRVAADVTTLLDGPAEREAFARYEHLADRYMAGHAVSGICGFNRTRVDDATLSGIACLHPTVSGIAPPFRLYASRQAHTSAVLVGEVDPASRALFATALGRVAFPLVDAAVVIDARSLSFMDHHGLLDIASFFGSRGLPVVLRVEADSHLLTLAGLIDVPGVRVRVG